MTTLIKNGTVVSATGRHAAEVLVDGSSIAAVMAPGSATAQAAESGADRVIDATGKYVVPGGIDCHTHMELPFGGTFASDTFEIGTRAAAWGGTTTIIDFAVQKSGENVRDCQSRDFPRLQFLLSEWTACNFRFSDWHFPLGSNWENSLARRNQSLDLHRKKLDEYSMQLKKNNSILQPS